MYTESYQAEYSADSEKEREAAINRKHGVLIAPTMKLIMVRDSSPATLEHPQVRAPINVYDLLKNMIGDAPQEHLVVVLLDTKNNVIGVNTVYVGNVNTAVVRVAEVIRPAILTNATFMILAHNHPSGDPTPSPEDVRMTGIIVEAGRLMDIQVLDHIVVGQNCYVSLKERGLMA